MCREELKEFIKINLLDSNGYFNGHTVKGRINWYKKNNFMEQYNIIVSLTSFLINTTIGERIYCIVNDIEQIKCPFCKNNLRFFGWINGYSKTCKEKQCKVKYENLLLSNGLTINQNRAQKRKISITTKLTPEGITIAQAIGRASRDTLRKTRGQDYFSNFAKESCEVLRNDIDEYGVNGLQRRARLSVENRRLDIVNGLNKLQRTSLKAAETMKNTILDNGLTIYENNAIKTQETLYKRAAEIGDDGFLKTKSKIYRYEDTNLIYQGSSEKCFLDFLKNINMLKKVQRGPTISYISIDNQRHLYFSDYIMFLKIFEVKSKYTYDRNGKVLDIRKINNLKFRATLEQGKELFIVWDAKFLYKPSLYDLQDITSDLYQSNKFIPLNNENFLNIFH